MPGNKTPDHGPDHRPYGADPVGVGLKLILVYAWDEVVESSSDPVAWIPIARDMDGKRLRIAEATVVTEGTGDAEIGLRNIRTSVSLLTSPIVVSAGEVSSHATLSGGVIDFANNKVTMGDAIGVYVDVGSDALGLCVEVGFW